MRLIMRLIVVLLALLVLVASFIFILENQQSVSLVFLGFAAPALPVSVVVCLGLIAGLILGSLLAVAFKRTSRK